MVRLQSEKHQMTTICKASDSSLINDQDCVCSSIILCFYTDILFDYNYHRLEKFIRANHFLMQLKPQGNNTE